MTFTPPSFDSEFLKKLDELFVWRRDVRHFTSEPLAPEIFDAILDRACLAPSVGNSQPWRLVRVDSQHRRDLVIENFERCNTRALAGYSGEQARLYSSLKLAGLQDAPVHLAVFTDVVTSQGHGLGKNTMPEVMHYSTSCMIMSLWLAARARGVGVGWVSIVDPNVITGSLDVPRGWEFNAYLCLGYPDDQEKTPELERLGWQSREHTARRVLSR
ncbi:MAG: 5,6-dimethylbenzimidazole synthase [Pseudomonadota bacterium]